jgi:formyl-CoA transferase
VGQHIDLGLLDVGVASMANIASAYLGAGVVSKRNGGVHPSVLPSQVFECSDGYVIVAAANDSQFAKLCDVAGRPELRGDPRFATNSARIRNRSAITPVLEEIFRRRSVADWTKTLAASGVPCGPIYTIDQVFEDPQVKARGMKFEMPYAPAGKLAMTASPIRLSATPPAYPLPPPLLGEHTAQVLSDMLGLSTDDIARLRQRGAI